MSEENKKQQDNKGSNNTTPSSKERVKDRFDSAEGKSQQRNQMDEGKQHQQIKNPPITTKPKDK